MKNHIMMRHIPLILVTDSCDPKLRIEAAEYGVSDYIIKPFEEKDLLATITGRLKRVQRIEKFDENLSSFKLEKAEIEHIQKENLYLLYVIWDDKLGPELKDFHPKEEEFHIPLGNLANQLFSAATSIYGQNAINKAEGLLINIKNINSYGYLYFDSYPSEKERYGEKQYMLAFVSPFISYLHSLEIKTVLEEISMKVKEHVSWNIEDYWKLLKKFILDRTE